MRAVLSPLTFDPLGVVVLSVAPAAYGATSRRMNRVPTLDGGAAFNDFGYSEADRTLTLTWAVTSATLEAAVQRLVTLYAQLHVATPQGLYLAAPDTYTPGAAESTLTLLVVDKLA